MRTLFAALLLAAAATAADPPVPVLTAQTVPLGTGMDDIRAVVRLVAGDPIANEMDAAIKEGLGEKMFAGIDTTKPMGGYLYLSPPPGGKKVSQVNHNDALRMVSGVLLIPVTKPAEFNDFLERLSSKGPGIKVTPVDGTDGLYQMDSTRDPAPFPIRVRYAGGYAHFGLNRTDEQMAEKVLLPADKVIDPKETAKAAVRYHLDRLPAEYPAEVLTRFDAAVSELADRSGANPSFAEAAALDALKLLRAYLTAVVGDGQVSTQRLFLDAKTGEATLETALTGKPGSKLTAAIAARQPTTNRFAGLVTDRAAASVVTSLPLFDAELRGIVAKMIDGAATEIAKQPGTLPKPARDALAAGLVRTVKTGQFDLGLAVNGPDKDGHFTAVAAVAFENPADLEKAIRELLKSAPKETQDAIALDADKAGDVGIHKITPPGDFPPPLRTVLGGSTIYVAFAPKGIYVASGPDAVPALKAALAAKPAAAKALDVTANPKRVGRLAAAADKDAGPRVEKAFGTDDKTQPVLSLDVVGGEKLTIRVTANVRLIGSSVSRYGQNANAQFQAVPVPVPVKKN